VVSGTIMGQSLSGLGNLLAMPYGCGEQNMINFAPDVYVLKYLQSIGQASDPTAADALDFLNSGRLSFSHYNEPYLCWPFSVFID
jgi:CD109 antigen